ncbi:MAG: single-stranded DNA-binding protein [Bacteroides sp.]|jgi:single-strand DNA-binding protein|nr:single-stranded DNA-binding protein [Bacteroides sp.]
MKKDIVNQFSVSGFIGQDATVRNFEKSSVARFSLAVSKGEKDKDGKTQYTSAFVSIEAWRKNENLASFDLLKKGQMITINGYFKPEQWTAEDGTLKNRVIFVAVKFFATPDKEETPEKG